MASSTSSQTTFIYCVALLIDIAGFSFCFCRIGFVMLVWIWFSVLRVYVVDSICVSGQSQHETIAHIIHIAAPNAIPTNMDPNANNNHHHTCSHITV